MNNPVSAETKPRPPIPLPFHYAWLIVVVTFFASFNGAGIRVVPTVLIHPLEADFGWARSAITFGFFFCLFRSLGEDLCGLPADRR